MNNDQLQDLIWGGLCLVIVGSALASQLRWRRYWKGRNVELHKEREEREREERRAKGAGPWEL
jgi:hypothetical protein